MYYFIGTRKWITFNQSIQLISDYLFCYINWRAVNYRNSPKHANSPEWLVLGWKYSPKSFYTRSWRAVVSHTVMGILFFSYLYFIIIHTIECNCYCKYNMATIDCNCYYKYNWWPYCIDNNNYTLWWSYCI
jgi:hypothetical protein